MAKPDDTPVSTPILSRRQIAFLSIFGGLTLVWMGVQIVESVCGVLDKREPERGVLDKREPERGVLETGNQHQGSPFRTAEQVEVHVAYGDRGDGRGSSYSSWRGDILHVGERGIILEYALSGLGSEPKTVFINWDIVTTVESRDE